MILIADKTPAAKGTTCYVRVESLQPPYPDVAEIIRQSSRSIPSSSLRGTQWILADKGTDAAIASMAHASVPLSEYIDTEICMGIKTGLNQAFIIDSFVRKKLLELSRLNDEIIVPLASGSNIRKWRIEDPSDWLIYAYHGIDIERYPGVKDHLQSYRERLDRRATKQEWYELQQPQFRYQRYLAGKKIAFPDIAKSVRFAFDPTGTYVTNTAYFIPSDDFFLLGLLNSSAVETFYLEVSTQIRGGYVRFFRQYVQQIPIPQAPPADRNAIAELAQKCLNAKGQGPEVAEWEAEINARVARLYGLNEDGA